jgi:hypothetical protein
VTKDEAKAHLESIGIEIHDRTGRLSSGDSTAYVADHWDNGRLSLDGSFTSADLMAFAVWIEGRPIEPEE